MAHYTGGCLCGAIRYEIAGDPIFGGHCHCRDCQRTTGAGHSSLMAFPQPAVKLTGSPKYYSTKADSGSAVSRGFCTNCGSPVVSNTSGMPGMIIITAGSLDDPGQFHPTLVVYAKRANPWDVTDQSLAHFPAMPPM
jgi:hypothetical protein